MRESTATGIDAMRIATALLQRARAVHPTAGVWDAADMQWWWRRPRASDDLPQTYWSDDVGPVAMGLVTDWGELWQLDPLVVPGSGDGCLEQAFERGLRLCEQQDVRYIDVLTDDADAASLRLLSDAGFVVEGEPGGTGWADAAGLNDVRPLPEGYELTDRSRSPDGTHWLVERSGPDVERRLTECSLYEPTLDLAVFTADGELASYALLWLDRTTHVGMIEPMRTQDAHQRRGVGRAMLSAGLRRLVDRGARRLKVGWEAEAARDLYLGLGFVQTQTVRLHRRTKV